MGFSILSINHIAEKNIWDYVINIAGLIIIPLVIYFLSSVYGVRKKERIDKICALNSLSLYCKNLLQEILKLRDNEARRRNALNDYINNPAPENFIKAFYVVRTPTLQYKLTANDYAFTSNQYPALIDLIFEIDSNLKTVTTFITEFNMHSEEAIGKSEENKIRMAKEMLLRLDSFHHNCCIVSYLINQLINAVKIYNTYFFFQDIINLEFSGRMKELLDCATAELDAVYNPAANPWRKTFLENIENPPVKFVFKDILNIIYLKFCGIIDKTKRNFKKKIFAIKIQQDALKIRQAKSSCKPEKIQELHTQYKNILEKFERCKEKLNDAAKMDISLNIQPYKTLMYQINQLISAMKNIFQIIPPERSILLTSEEISQVEINLSFLATNFIPCFNNIFKLLYSYYFPEKDIENINFLSPELNEILDAEYQNKLQAFYKSELYQFIKSYELPFELPEAIQNENGELFVCIKIIPNDKNGIKEVYIYEFLIKTLNLLLNTTLDCYQTIIKCSFIRNSIISNM